MSSESLTGTNRPSQLINEAWLPHGWCQQLKLVNLIDVRRLGALHELANKHGRLFALQSAESILYVLLAQFERGVDTGMLRARNFA